MSKFQQAAEKFAAQCKKLGWRYEVSHNVVRITKNFAPNDNEAYVQCDGEAYSIISLAPLRGGSVWGTDGGSVGGYVGLKGGYYTLNKSGSGATFLKCLGNLPK